MRRKWEVIRALQYRRIGQVSRTRSGNHVLARLLRIQVVRPWRNACAKEYRRAGFFLFLFFLPFFACCTNVQMVTGHRCEPAVNHTPSNDLEAANASFRSLAISLSKQCLSRASLFLCCIVELGEFFFSFLFFLRLLSERYTVMRLSAEQSEIITASRRNTRRICRANFVSLPGNT